MNLANDMLEGKRGLELMDREGDGLVSKENAGNHL